MATSNPIDKLRTLPIIYITTHGVYDLTDGEDPVVFTTPSATMRPARPNTYVIETQSLGDYCMTNIDEHFWNLIQGPWRDTFVSYLKGGYSDPDDEDDEAYIRLVQNLHVYGPGRPIVKRTLVIGGGRENENHSEEGRESLRVSQASMGFFRLNADDKVVHNFPSHETAARPATAILEDLRTSLITDYDELGNSATTSNDVVIDLVYERYPDLRKSGAIFIFSSCAEAWEGSDKQLALIEKIQRDADLRFMHHSTAFAEGPGESSAAGAAAAAAAPSGRSKSRAKQVAAPGANYSMAMGGPGFPTASRHEESFHPSAYEEENENENNNMNENEDENENDEDENEEEEPNTTFFKLANTSWASRGAPPRHPRAEDAPKGFIPIWVKHPARDEFKQIYNIANGSMYFDRRAIRIVMRKFGKDNIWTIGKYTGKRGANANNLIAVSQAWMAKGGRKTRKQGKFGHRKTRRAL
jgi:hypothetical protein